MLKIYNSLPKEAEFIRRKVFAEEQGFCNEFDDLDQESAHIVLFVDGKPAGTCRFFWNSMKKSWQIGRLAVLPDFRKRGFGHALLAEAERQIAMKGGKTVMVSAQSRERLFYEKSGYRAYGDEYLDEHCPHVAMNKAL